MSLLSRRLVGIVANRERRRLRMPVRILATVVIWITVSAVVGYPVTRVLTGPDATLSGLRSTETGTVALLGTAALLGVVVPVLTVYLGGRLVDRRPFSDFGMALDRDWWTDLGFGLALGAGLMTAIFVLELSMGWIEVTGLFQPDRTNTSIDTVFPWLLLAVLSVPLAAFGEELLVRGYLLKNLAEGLDGVGPLGRTTGVVLAVAVSSILFGLKHVSNPNASLTSTAAIGLAGILLALGFVLTRSMAVPIGLHVAWNFFQGVVYGFPISGTGYSASVVSITQGGPETVTGGSFGPEAGLVGVAAILLGMAAIVVYARVQYGRIAVHPTFTTPRSLTDPAEDTARTATVNAD